MKREIIIEIERVRVIHSRRQSQWCEFCGAETEILTFAEAAGIAGVAPEKLSDFIAQGEIHRFQPTPDETRICMSSLLKTGNHLLSKQTF